MCEVGPEESYWANRGGTAKGEHDWACIVPAMKCSSLIYTRPNTRFTTPVDWDQCSRVFPTTTRTTGAPTTSLPPPQRHGAPPKAAAWSGDPGDWGLVQWMVIGTPLLVLGFAFCFVYCFFRKRRTRQLQRVYVAPQRDAGPLQGAGSAKIKWDMAQAGRLSPPELQKVWKAVQEAEQAEARSGAIKAQARHLAFGLRNDLGEQHLKMLGALLNRHTQVSISLDTDWRLADDACLRALAAILRKRDRCTLEPDDGSAGQGLNTLRLPLSSGLEVVQALAETLTGCHTEVDAICFAPPGASQSHMGKSTSLVNLTSLRQSCQELVLRRCALADLGTVAVCAFIRPWAARIQIIRLTECEITDEGAVALSRLLGPALKELCLTANSVGDRGISEIAKALSVCDSLDRLLLDRNSIGDEGAKALGAHLLRSNVQELTLGSHLGSNPVGEEGVEALARALNDELPRAAANRAGRLCALNLDGCIVGQRGAQALATNLPKSAIMALSVARGHLGDSGAEAIIQTLPRTCLSLDLSGNGLTDSSATSVAEAFYRIPQLAVSLANNHLTVGLRAILHEEHGSRLRL